MSAPCWIAPVPTAPRTAAAVPASGLMILAAPRDGISWGACSTKKFVNKAKALNAASTAAMKYDISFVNRFVKALFTTGHSIDTKSRAASEALTTEWTNTVAHYGMLRLIEWYNIDDRAATMIVDYINLVEKAK